MNKILVLAKDYPPTIGGVENYSFYIAEGLSQEFEVNVLTFKGRDSENTWEDSVEVFRINPIVKSNEILKGLQYFFTLFRILLVDKIDLVYATTWKIGIPARILKSVFSFKLIIVSHGAEITRHKNKKYLVKLMNFVIKGCNGVISVSEFTKNKVIEYNDVFRDKVFVVPNGIDTSKLTVYPQKTARNKLNIENDFFTILTVARVDERKGHELVIKSIPEIIKTITNFKYVIVGNGPIKKDLEALVVKLKLSNFVDFKGFVANEDLDYYYSATDVFIMINTMKDDRDFEGFGLVFAEAGFYGKPLIGGDNSGPKEVILTNVSGYLLNETTDEIAKSIINLYKDPLKLKDFGVKAKERTMSYFTIKKMIKGTSDVLHIVLENK